LIPEARCGIIGKTVAARVTLKAINDEMARLGYMARLAKASGYFYFQFGEAAEWLDRTVPVDKVSSKTLEEWIAEFRRLAKVNQELSRAPGKKGKR
jgi:hypothetical protein